MASVHEIDTLRKPHLKSKVSLLDSHAIIVSEKSEKVKSLKAKKTKKFKKPFDPKAGIKRITFSTFNPNKIILQDNLC
jgi:hypothetical protein